MSRIITRLVVFAALLLSGCGKNYYTSFEDKDGEDGEKERIQALLDDGEYDEARLAAERLLKKGDSNDVRLLLVSARLGQIDAALWDQVKFIIKQRDDLDDQEVRDLTGDGTESEIFYKLVVVYQVITLIAGEENEADRRWLSLNDSLELLVNAPDPSERRMHDAACYLAALDIVPTIMTALRAGVTVLNSVTDIFSENITGSAICQVLDTLDDGIGRMLDVERTLGRIVDVANSCGVLSRYKQARDSVEKASQFEIALNQLIVTADKGCDGAIPFLPTDEALVPKCLVDKLKGASKPVAGDGRVQSCEIMTNCLSGEAECFSFDKFLGDPSE